MSDVHTFFDKDKKFELSVKTEFLTKCPNPHDYDAFELNSQFYMFKYLHNPHGYAIHRLKDGRKEYWLDGISLTKENPEQASKIEHSAKFNVKLNEILE